MAKVFELADLMPPRLRALVLLATFASLRWGEVAALRRMVVDLTAGTVSIRQQHVELDTGELLVGPPKSRAGVRTVAIQEGIIPALREHLDQFTAPEADALIFTGARGRHPPPEQLPALGQVGREHNEDRGPGPHFHDLRHTGNHRRGSGASLEDLMQRMGHDSVRAGLIYQHSTAEADRRIADAMNAKITKG